MTDWKKIRQEWETTDITFVDLAKKHDLKASTIRSRKNRENWQRNATQQKNVATKKSNATKKEKAIAEEVKSVMENDNLTDKQRLFCLYYTKYFNATKAYKKAYGCDEYIARVNGSRLLTNANIKDEIYRLKQGKLNRAMSDETDLFQMYLDIATANINDFVDFGTERLVAKDKKGNPILDSEGNNITFTSNYISFKDSDEVDGALISEISEGQTGSKIKLQDKMKAMTWLDKNIGLATEEQRARIDKLKVETKQIAEKEKEAEPPTINIIDRWDDNE